MRERLRIPIILALVVAIVSGGMLFLYRHSTPTHAIEIIPPSPPERIIVHVSGEVATPGLCSLPAGARIGDAIDAAGGFAPGADTSTVNLAQPLRDGDRVHVYQTGELPQRININTADTWLLEALPSIGEARARAIVESRANDGYFRSVEDLVTRKLISEAILDKIRELITTY